MHNEPLAYLITFSTYATWLHGDERGSVDRNHRSFATPFIAPDSARASSERQRAGECIVLDHSMRLAVTASIDQTCRHRGWRLFAINVRTNHVHVVVDAFPATPDRVMNDLKSYASRRLFRGGLVSRGSRIWTRHGSTRYLFNRESVQWACDYVVNQQGPDINKQEPRP